MLRILAEHIPPRPHINPGTTSPRVAHVVKVRNVVTRVALALPFSVFVSRKSRARIGSCLPGSCHLHESRFHGHESFNFLVALHDFLRRAP